MGRTCGQPDEIKKNTHPKQFTALFRERTVHRHLGLAAATAELWELFVDVAHDDEVVRPLHLARVHGVDAVVLRLHVLVQVPAREAAT